jgi:hypothetical protein
MATTSLADKEDRSSMHAVELVVFSMNLLRDAYAIDCATLAMMSLAAAWKPRVLVKLLFIWRKEIPIWAERALRFVALFCAVGALTAMVLRVVQKGG